MSLLHKTNLHFATYHFLAWAVETRFLNIYFNQNVDNCVCDRAVSCFTTEINSITSFYI